jgi:hypothetical protein
VSEHEHVPDRARQVGARRGLRLDPGFRYWVGGPIIDVATLMSGTPFSLLFLLDFLVFFFLAGSSLMSLPCALTVAVC